MTFVEVLLNVLSIIGIVAIGGAVIYFLGGLLLSILESKNKKETIDFQKKLESLGVTATIRRTLGADIDASCGQLKKKVKEEIDGASIC